MTRRRKRKSSAATLFTDTAMVMGLRLTQLALNSAPAGEAQRMVQEKPAAFATAATRATAAAARAALAAPFNPFAAPLAAQAAFTASLGRKVKANRRRLSRKRR